MIVKVMIFVYSLFQNIKNKCCVMLLNDSFLQFKIECLTTLMIFVTILDADVWQKMKKQGFSIDYQELKFNLTG